MDSIARSVKELLVFGLYSFVLMYANVSVHILFISVSSRGLLGLPFLMRSNATIRSAACAERLAKTISSFK